MQEVTRQALALATGVALGTGGLILAENATVQHVDEKHIARHEGKVNNAYADPVLGWAVPTICYGHTTTTKRGQFKSDKECLDLLKTDADKYLTFLKTSVKGYNVKLTQQEITAYTSLIFNIGPSNWNKSSALKNLRTWNYEGACKAILPWNKSGGRYIQGLANRRADETALCLKGVAQVQAAEAVNGQELR